MMKIEEYVNSIYKNFNGDQKDIQELKNEMKVHLIEAVNDLKAEGKSEEEAIRIALERFGDKKQIIAGLFSLFQTQKRFAQKLFRASFIFLAIGIIVWFGLMWRDNQYKNTQEQLTTEILNILGNTSEITAEKENKIRLILQKETNVGYFEIIKKQNNKDTNLPVAQEVKLVWGHQNDPGMIGKENDTWIVQFQFKEHNYRTLYAFPYSLFSVFLVLIFIWVIVNVYHKRFYKLNKM